MISFKQYMKESLILEGGQFGHLDNVYDVNFKFSELKSFMSDALKGDLEFIEEKCLDGDTIIIVDGIQQKISDVVDKDIGNMVLSYDIETDTFIERTILGKSTHGIQSDWIKIELENGVELNVTPTHRLYVENRGYIPACSLSEDDELVFRNEIKS